MHEGVNYCITSSVCFRIKFYSLFICMSQVWDLFYEADKVREMLTHLIQEEALRTYLFTYSHVYDSISMRTLAQMFQLEKPVVHSTISKMIINEELMVNLCTTFLLNLKRTTV
jgi:hypothetical protein